MYILLITAIIYIIRAHITLPHSHTTAPTAPESQSLRTASPRAETIRRSGSMLTPTIKPRFSFIWMSVPKNYRHVALWRVVFTEIKFLQRVFQ